VCNEKGWCVINACCSDTACCCGHSRGAAAEENNRLGYLSLSLGIQPVEEAFQQGLRELGYVDGQNIVIEWRFAKGKADLLPELAAELVRLKVDVIIASATLAIQAAKQATKTIPIVFPRAGDPVAYGLVDSLARPGGNVTGMSNLSLELSGKRLELLKEALPRISRVAVFYDPQLSLALKETQTAGSVPRGQSSSAGSASGRRHRKCILSNEEGAGGFSYHDAAS
jgi:putative ABC transport system substrate-binding protein